MVPDDSTRGLPQLTLGAAVTSITLTGLDMAGHRDTETETCMLAETIDSTRAGTESRGGPRMTG